MQNTMGYYEHRKKWFERRYWDEEHDDLLTPNGICNDPDDIYDKASYIASLISNHGKIIDLGCGNGYLLKLIMERSEYNLIPFGIDFLDKSVKQAQNKVLPIFKSNFYVGKAVHYRFKALFEYVLTNPECSSTKDFKQYFSKCYNLLEKNGILIFYAPKDSYEMIVKKKEMMNHLSDLNMEINRNITFWNIKKI